jgi:hypothetical protein
MNVSSNWSSLVEIYNENGTIQYVNASEYDDSFVVVEVFVYWYLALHWSVFPIYHLFAIELLPYPWLFAEVLSRIVNAGFFFG